MAEIRTLCPPCTTQAAVAFQDGGWKAIGPLAASVLVAALRRSASG